MPRASSGLSFTSRNASQTARASRLAGPVAPPVGRPRPDGRLSYLTLLADGVSLMQAGAPNKATPLLERAAAGPRNRG